MNVSNDLAYIAGFLDGDGSVMLQLKPRQDYVMGFQIKATIAFYQKTNNRMVLDWLQSKLNVGRVRDRNDGISQYDIEGYTPVKYVLELIEPFVVLKSKQVKMALALIREIEQERKTTPEQFLERAKKIEIFQMLNYSKRSKYGYAEVKAFLNSKRFHNPRND